jgi:hypothetical protein
VSTYLVVAAHPDDPDFGVAGTAARHNLGYTYTEGFQRIVLAGSETDEPVAEQAAS